MVRKMSEDLVEDKNSWEDIEEAMRQPEQMLIQVESILPQVIQASSTERRLNAEAEFKEYLQNNPHNFGPEDLLELDPCRIFCDNEARIEEIASVFRQQLREEERSQYPDVELDIKEDFDEIVEMLAWRKIVEDVIRVD
ncbi:unnamed protein product [Acanthoscelides obtectus]|nr:unnamed protein product [Acanthoscelides obtectus]CAK1671431.1 hypothetical protein AOBTE_LOCUS28256 [Acanthoscelides obtectus]